MYNDYSQLLIDIQKKSNITVTSIRDVKYLKEELDAVTNKPLGFNTLRRLFGFLDKTVPSLATLNTLSIYLGFSSFSSYKNNQANYSEWYFQQSLLRMQKLKRIGKEEISKINIGLLDEKNIIFLAYFLSFQVEKNNLEILNAVFKYVDFKSISNTQFHKFSTTISLGLSNISEKKALTIYETLIPYDTFRNNIPLLFIDYTNLNSRYYKILNIIEKNNANESDIFFVSLMRFYKYYYSEYESFLNYDIKKPKEFPSFYSVLKGRFYGCCILQSQKVSPKLKKEIFDACSSNRVSFFLEEIVPALIIKEEYDVLKEIMDKYYEELFESDIWSSTTTSAIYLIGLSNINRHSGFYSRAKTNLELVDLEVVEIGYYDYLALFYYFTKLKISFSENEIDTNQNALKNLKLHVKKTGFKLFLTLAKGYILR
ncbi:hypothetical protein [Flavobacterium sp.]|jgi:hypothetical protein|uniref:hypothetical protein n=1 Tax=Flavobacterium sp. TaxID=239 RepID=UPI0037BEC69D